MAIKIGDKCPDFVLENQDGVKVNIQDLIGDKLIVLYFYPKDNTWGCTKQACSFRDNYDEFLALNCLVLGISSDSVLSHKTFSEQFHLNFPILSDIDDSVRKKFGVPTSFFGMIKGRVTYIIDKNGIVKGVYNSQLNSTSHISKAIGMINNL